MLPQAFIDQVKKETNMVKLASKYTELRKAGPDIYVGRCPNPKHKDSDPSFTVFTKSNSWCCYGCHVGKKGKETVGSDCIAFLQWVENLSWIQSILRLASEAQIPVPTDENDHIYKYKSMLASTYWVGLKGEPLQYLMDRGLNQETIKMFGLGFDGKKIIFPLFDRYKNILGFSKRWLHQPEGTSDKYWNPPNSKLFNKSMYFYGIHLLNEESDEIRITEGPMDVTVAKRWGVKNIVATQGTAFTETHAEIIKNLGKIPVFIYDGDDAGMKGIRRGIRLLAELGVYAKILILPSPMDLADLSNELKAGTEDYIQDRAITYGQFMIQDVMNIYDSKLTEVKLKLYPMVKNLLAEIPNADERKIITDMVKEKMHIDL